MLFNLKHQGKKYSVQVKEMLGLERGFGLMFRTRKADNLLFFFSKPSRVAITAWFVFFPFLAVWCDKGKKVVDLRLVRPFETSFLPKKDASYLIEIPFNEKNEKIIKKLMKVK